MMRSSPLIWSVWTNWMPCLIRGSWFIPSPFLASLAQFGDEQHEQRAAKSGSPPRVFLDHLLGGMGLGKAGDYEPGLA
jgi:hypothetical protein